MYDYSVLRTRAYLLVQYPPRTPGECIAFQLKTCPYMRSFILPCVMLALRTETELRI